MAKAKSKPIQYLWGVVVRAVQNDNIEAGVWRFLFSPEGAQPGKAMRRPVVDQKFVKGEFVVYTVQGIELNVGCQIQCEPGEPVLKFLPECYVKLKVT